MHCRRHAKSYTPDGDLSLAWQPTSAGFLQLPLADLLPFHATSTEPKVHSVIHNTAGQIGCRQLPTGPAGRLWRLQCGHRFSHC